MELRCDWLVCGGDEEASGELGRRVGERRGERKESKVNALLVRGRHCFTKKRWITKLKQETSKKEDMFEFFNMNTLLAIVNSL